MSATEIASEPASALAVSGEPERLLRRWSGRWLAAFACASIAWVAAWLEPPGFTSTATFAWRGMPPQPDALALQDLLVGLDGRSLGRRVVERLDLERAWALAPGWQAEARLARRVRVVTDRTDGSFRIEVRDSDAARAAAIADTCLDELRDALVGPGRLAPAAWRGTVELIGAASAPKEADARHVWLWALGGAMLGLAAAALGSAARSPRPRGNLR